MAAPPQRPNKKPSPQEARTAGARVFLVLLFLLIGFLWYQRHVADDPKPVVAETPAPAAKPEKPSEPEAPSESAVATANVNAAPTAPPATPPPAEPAPAQAPEVFQAEFKKCFPEKSSPQTAADFLSAQVTSSDVEQRENTAENLRVNDGSKEIRLNIIPRDENAEVRTFAVGADGTPQADGQRQWMTTEAAENFKQEFLRRGKVIFQQRNESLLYVDGMHAEVEYLDDKVHTATFFRPGGSFYCSAGECRCKLPPGRI